MPAKPYRADPIRFGTGSLDLVPAVDVVADQDATRLQNLVQTTERGALTQRPGQTSLATSSGTVLHSAKRLNDPQGSTFTRLWGVDTSLHRAASGAMGAAIEGGFSGDPLSLVPYRPQLSGDAFMFVGDRTKMRQVSGAFDTTIGLAPPTAAAAAVAATELKTTIHDFDTAVGWTVGITVPPPTPIGGPPAVPVPIPNHAGTAASALQFTTAAGIADGAYYNFWILDLTGAVLNLDIVGGGTALATDDDLIHLRMKIDRPDLVSEVQLMLLTTANFDAFVKPGSNVAAPNGQKNSDYFIKTFRPADFQPFLDQVQAPRTIEEQNALSDDVLADLGRHSDEQRRGGEADNVGPEGTVEPVFLRSRTLPPDVSTGLVTAGRATWNEFSGTPETTDGVVSIPIRRGDFTRVGEKSDRGWSNINGLCVLVTVKDKTNGVIIGLDDLYLSGGHGLDSSDVAAEPYDFVYTHYDPRTGDESNPSPVRTVTDGAITAATQSLASAAALFAEDDVGKAIIVYGAGDSGSNLHSTITAFTSTSAVTIADRAGTTVAGARVDWDGTGQRLELLRRAATVTPAAGPSAEIRQRFYRRGGTSNTDHFFEGENGSNGGVFTSTATDLVVQSSNLPAPRDHDQPVTTVNEHGLEILAQALPALWGPLADYLFACGDPYRPGHVYHSQRGEPGHWPAANLVEVCSPSEEVMHGVVYGGESFVFSRARLYRLVPDALGAGTVASFPTACKKGLAARWAFAVGPGGIYFLALDGIYVTRGGEPQSLTDGRLYGLFHGTAVHGLLAVDYTADTALRLTVYENELRFLYQDSGGARRELIFSILTQDWRFHTYGRALALISAEEDGTESTLIMGGLTTGDAYTHTGVTDDGVNITCLVRTGARGQGLQRAEKNYGDLIVELDRSGETVTLAPFINDEATALATIAVSTLAGRQRYILAPFGTLPQRARNVSLQLSWTASGGGTPVLYLASMGYIPQPDTTVQRMSDWDDLGQATEKYITGITLDVDTANLAKTVLVEGTLLTGAVTTIATLTITANGRKQLQFFWSRALVSLVRLRPTDANPWLVYDEDTRWQASTEPPRDTFWDTGDEAHQDTYYTGLNIVLDTFNVAKTLAVTVDGVAVTGSPFTITANGKRLIHLTFGPATGVENTGHIYRAVFTDTDPVKVYQHAFLLQPEPSAQANWNQNFSVLEYLGDKQVKGVIFDCDTQNVAKTVTIEADGVVQQTLTVTANRRTLLDPFVWAAFKGGLIRIVPTDSHEGKLYAHTWIYDEEPLFLTRWEVLATDHGFPQWHYPLFGDLMLNSTTEVTLQITAFAADGTSTALTPVLIASTGGVRRKVHVTFNAVKGRIFTYLLTSAQAVGVDAPFHLYQAESTITLQAWPATEAPIAVHPFGGQDVRERQAQTRQQLTA